MPPHEITDVLGRTRAVFHTYPDGSWSCPFCTAAASPERPCTGYTGGCAHGEHCPNPACSANPHYPVDVARAKLAEHEARERVERERKANHEWAMKRGEEDRKARAEKLSEIRAEATSRGACIRCALHDAPYRAKFVKHRSACPREAR